MKRVYLGVVVSALALTMASCGGGSDTEKLAQVFADYACDMHQLLEEAKSSPDQVSAVMQRRSEVQKKLEENINKKFGNEAKAEEAFDRIGDQEALAEAIRTKAKAQCNPSEEILDGAVGELM